MNALTILALLLAGHALADYPLQGDWMSKAKNHKLDLVPGEAIWPLALLSHTAIQGAMVGLVTGSPLLGFLEFIVHTIIDYSKCDGRIGYNTDQALHIACKFAWVGLILAGVS